MNKARKDFLTFMNKYFDTDETLSCNTLKEYILEKIPGRLFRYRSGDSYSIAALINDEVWFASPNTFNDPYDALVYIKENEIYNYSKEACINSCKKGLIDELTQALSCGNTNKILEDLRSKDLIACFSETMNSFLMWSHYANSHKGFVIEYNFKYASNLFEYIRYISPVFYQKERIDFTKVYVYSMLLLICTNNNEYPAGALTDECIRKELFLYNTTKMKEWEYEKEWRLILKQGFKSIFVPVKALYIGSRTPEVLKEALIRIARYKNIKCYQMFIDNNPLYGMSDKEIKL